MPRLFTIGSIASHAIVVGGVLAAQALDTGPLPSPRSALTFAGSIPVRIADIPVPRPPRRATSSSHESGAPAATTSAPPFLPPQGIQPETASPSIAIDPRGGGGLVDVGFGVDGAVLGDPVYTPGPPPAPIPRPVHTGGDVAPPRKIAHVDPVYPALARASHVSGVVILDATIDTHGRVVDVRVLRSIPLLDQAAMDAVRRWTFTPTRLNGVAVPVIMTVTVNFTLGQ
ncbi:MAG TPA: TonB family protein [Vicinamibacterales bacterium]|nr:TonB family protein [Vicinamibacterales bacterium]